MAEFLKDENGKTSSMRIMSFIALFGSIFFGYFSMKWESEFGLYLSFLFLLAAFVPKALQKMTESQMFLGKIKGNATV